MNYVNLGLSGQIRNSSFPQIYNEKRFFLLLKFLRMKQNIF
nr:MAG TPA: hypothetical protein [Caudoviricetes sp.]